MPNRSEIIPAVAGFSIVVINKEDCSTYLDPIIAWRIALGKRPDAIGLDNDTADMDHRCYWGIQFPDGRVSIEGYVHDTLQRYHEQNLRAAE